MRIGELAAIAGVTTRTVRHYHRIGLLPEPARQPNGYREYGLRDAVELARVRRLTELGLSLDEVRDALADDAGKNLHEILTELDADLARQEEAIRQRRARLAELLRRADTGGLPPEGPVSPELAVFFDDMARVTAVRPGPEPAMAAKERELLALLDAAADAGHRVWLMTMMRTLSSNEDAIARAYEIYARLDELADAATDDPRIPKLARAIADSMPEEVARSAAEGATRAGNEDGGGFAEAFFADFPPAQAQVLRRAMLLLQERGAR
ncbi:MerR family transcriptional regulator [Streptantibioticus rubrisoli]|uniref:MerR family transcriptional regulator n=1 Tax=Streptantibioticus rubrisoli TaxID=1387313 RepID=A0ABT1PCI3_9ACTN|nr:MerR family transcriptional regulator [Streptantibioticus rubrisoli]MCQ4043074.1 MerR family transcriptional regulator [Streptantibioticus rubrisoli]